MSRVKALIKLLVTLALLALIFWQIGGLAPIAAAFSDLHWGFVAALVGVTLLDRVLMAYKWLLLSVTVNFDEQAVLESNLLARRMSAAQIEEARARAQSWSNRFFFGDKVAGPRVKSIPATE